MFRRSFCCCNKLLHILLIVYTMFVFQLCSSLTLCVLFIKPAVKAAVCPVFALYYGLSGGEWPHRGTLTPEM